MDTKKSNITRSMTRNQCGRLGGLKTKLIIAELVKNRIAAYNINPKLCKHCKKPLPYKEQRKIYCNSSCFASDTNRGRARNIKTGKNSKKSCINCGNITINAKYCSRKCFWFYYKKLWRTNLESGKYTPKYNTATLRNYLLSERGHRCEKCGNKEWMGTKIILTIHHIDGKASNFTLHNLQLLCWNCHSITPNFGTRGGHRGTRSYRYKKQ